MLKEVLFRRFSKVVKEKSGSLSLPDLIMVDGGKGQYSVSREVLNELGLHSLPIIAIAKGKNRNAGEEKMYYQNREFELAKNDPLLFFIQRLRDEAHRFAISTHRAKRKKNLSKSLLDQIQGIGKQRKNFIEPLSFFYSYAYFFWIFYLQFIILYRRKIAYIFFQIKDKSFNF